MLAAASKLHAEASVQPKTTAVRQDSSSKLAEESYSVKLGFVQPKTTGSPDSSSES